jgi:hypothetical protein
MVDVFTGLTGFKLGTPNRARMRPMPKPAPKPDDRAQSARFIKLAREVGAKGKPEDFERAFRAVVTAKRTAPAKKRTKR